MKVQSIGASAGTGKTTELTRIVRESIVNGRCRPHAVIGTTFTKKAAAELVERVRQELFKTGKIDSAERLAESLLGTVDSICMRLLSRFAFEAGISPDTVKLLKSMGYQVDEARPRVLARVEAILIKDGWVQGGHDGRGTNSLGKAVGY